MSYGIIIAAVFILAAGNIILTILNAVLRRKLVSKEGLLLVDKGSLEEHVSSLSKRLADNIERSNYLEQKLAVESDHTVRLQQAYTALERKREREKDNFNRILKDKLKESNNKQRSTIKGQVAEQLAPYLPEFEYNPEDARFLGMPFDYLIFDGMSDGNIKQVIFMEVKTGGSQLSTIQRNLRDIIKNNNVKWEVCRINVDEEKLL